MKRVKVSNGVYWVEIPEVDLFILCGCPADAVKHLMRMGLIATGEKHGVACETGPNAILLSELPIQNGCFSNLSEFPILQMLYRQGMLLPRHPNNTGRRPLLIGLEDQVRSQSRYIFRGNYGLASIDEIAAAGVPRETAEAMFRIKKWFAFDRILNTQELVEARVLNQDAVELRDGVFVHRKGLNRYEFLFDGESVDVDLNLGPDSDYLPPYELGSHAFTREHFSVIHIGEGDGWDVNRPCMSSLICFQGKLYLIDAGPTLVHSLSAMGISVNEIEGIFHTHAHDDHFAGLTSLLRSDHRINYYTTRLVRESAQNKLAALMNSDTDRFLRSFDIHDLEMDTWNDVAGMEVRPVYSPHPVETNVLYFRARGPGGCRTYAHLADIVAFDTLNRMVTPDTADSGLSRAMADKYMATLRERVDIKKVDIGGGLIHGRAEDFRDDPSGCVVLSHTALPLSDAQKEIGVCVPFGAENVLIAAPRGSYVADDAPRYLKSYFPNAPQADIDMLCDGPIVSFKPGDFMLRKDADAETVYLILGGMAEAMGSPNRLNSRRTAGALIGETHECLCDKAPSTYRASSFVSALRIPCRLYRQFVERNRLRTAVETLRSNRDFLDGTWLFGEMISFPVQHGVARIMERHTASAGTVIAPSPPALCLLEEGEVTLFEDGRGQEVLIRGGFWGEEAVLQNVPSFFDARATRDAVYYALPPAPLADIPIVLWKLVETFERRLKIFRTRFRFEWSEVYRLNIPAIDEQHKQLFSLIGALSGSAGAGGAADTRSRIDALVNFAMHHFGDEERMLEDSAPDLLAQQRKHHRALLLRIEEIRTLPESDLCRTLGDFLKDWLIEHTLLEDRKFMPMAGKHTSQKPSENR